MVNYPCCVARLGLKQGGQGERDSGKEDMVVLIDNGSTFSLLDEETATLLQCSLTTPLSVLIANGSRMAGQFKCIGFKWTMNGNELSIDLQILRLRGCHIVLGVDWMQTISPLIFDFNKVILVGCQGAGESKAITGNGLQRLSE